jgi:hypothetical protein
MKALRGSFSKFYRSNYIECSVPCDTAKRWLTGLDIKDGFISVIPETSTQASTQASVVLESKLVRSGLIIVFHNLLNYVLA